MMLDRLHLPHDIAALNEADMTALCSEVRDLIVTTVQTNGGHLASSLGAVELIVAMLHVFDANRDKLLFDVGHQAYAYKILTDRYARFGTLRRAGGISGFPNPQESGYDKLIAGHAGTALAAGCGYARAARLKGSDEHIVCVLGDGVLANGLTLESLNNVATVGGKIIVIVNDNDYSIDPSVGGMALQLAPWRQKPYHNTIDKENGPLSVYGLDYIGCVDGHNIAELCSALRLAATATRSVVVHVHTRKGCGYAPAEKAPVDYHSVDSGHGVTYSQRCGQALCSMAERDSRVVAVCAAMGHGSGLDEFARRFPNRFFDVGIAEGHALSMAAAMAREGFRPYVAIYSTFLQRAYDQIVVDIGQSGLPVMLLCDRSGLAGADGETHHGLVDRQMCQSAGLELASPCGQEELQAMLEWSLTQDKPLAIRYPRGEAQSVTSDNNFTGWNTLREGRDAVLVASGADMIAIALQVAEFAENSDIGLAVVNARFSTLDEKTMQPYSDMPCFVIECSRSAGGLGEAVAAWRQGNTYYRGADGKLQHGTKQELLYRCGLSVGLVWQWIRTALEKDDDPT